MKLLRSTPFILLMLILGNACFVNAQDTTKKAKPAVKKGVVYNAYTKKYYYKNPITPVTTAQTPATGKPAVTTPAQRPAQISPAPQPAAPVDKSLRGQYQYLLTKVYNYQQPLVAALFKNYSDTLSATRKQLKDAKATVGEQAKTIDTLKSSSTGKDQSLAQAQAKVDEVSLLGMPINKGTYNLIMWGLVIGFGVIAAIVIARSGSHSREAKYRIKLYEELEEEYKAYKTKANDKEKKLARELQTERNKLDELQNGGQ